MNWWKFWVGGFVIGVGVSSFMMLDIVTPHLFPNKTILGSTIEKATLLAHKNEAFELNAENLGLSCISNIEGCVSLVARAEKNPQLKAAFLKLKNADILIIPTIWPPFSVGSVGPGYVAINTHSTDEKIVAFLTN